MQNGRPVVAHLHDVFFLRSETFIYHTISRHERFLPLCLARRFENLQEFSFPAESRSVIPPPRILSRLYRKLSGARPHEEAFLRSRGADLLHAHFGPNGFAALALKRRLRLPLVTTFYGYDVSELARRPEWVARYHTLFREGDLFLVEGEYMESKLERLGCPARKIRIQKIAIPVSRIRFRTRGPKGPGEKAVLIFSGRFVEKKGLLDALEAVRRLCEKRSDFEFRLVGDGPLRPEVEAFITRHSMGSCAKLLGFLDYEGYLAELQRADIFVHPSVTASNGDDEGGAPVTILEAQAMGLPIVSTRHADIPNIVAEGQSALLCGEKDPAGIAANIAELLDDPGRWERMGLAGRRQVETHHDLASSVRRLEDLYLGLLKEGIHGPR